MILWVILTIMTALTAVAVAAPFLRQKGGTVAPESKELDVYRDQLKEIEREEKAGLIRPAESVEARKEIVRRLLAAEQLAKPKDDAKPSGDRTYAAIGVAGAVAIGSTILYANMGWPDLPGQPAANRPESTVAQSTKPVEDVATGGQDGVITPPPAENAGEQSKQPVGTVDDMIGRLVKRLATNSDNPDGWRMLGWAYFSQERFADSAAAYARAIEQNPSLGSLKTARGEALVRASGGTVNDEALALFAEALKQDAKDPRARYFAGLKKEQSGDRSAALDDWINILNETSPSEPWAADLRQRTEGLAGELKVDISTRLTAAAVPPTAAARGGVLDAIQTPSADAPSPAPVAEKGPTAEDVKKSQDMAPQDRTAMIRGMVESLQSRLEKSPRDADGWIKLIRSRKVLGEDDAAKSALAKAVAVFSDAPDEQGRISAEAKALGVTN